MKKITSLLAIAILLILGCTKKLDLKPDSNLVIPKSAKDLENILDNSDVINTTPALAQLSADEYFIPNLQTWQNLQTATERNLYIWKSDIFEGATKVSDWTVPYNAIFYSNSVLDILSKQNITDDSEKKNIKGWALFIRSYNFYTLVSLYSKAYNEATAVSDLGIPLKLSSDIRDIVPRNSVQKTYEQVINDALLASELLNTNITNGKRNRPSKIAAYAFLARVYLSMRKYDQAEVYADKSITLYPNLIDYNTLDTTAASAFTYNSLETIYFTQQIPEFSSTSYGPALSYGVDSNLLALYKPGDLRIPIFFQKNSIGKYNFKAINSLQGYPFTGLAIDEIYLIKAECLARRGQTDSAIFLLNSLVKTRMKTGTFTAISAGTAVDALDRVLIERRKELVWRSIRWTDLKRFNLDGQNISLTRNLNGMIYTLEPNSPKYILPIPDDEIALSGIQQNIR